MSFKINHFTGNFDEVTSDIDQIPIGDADTYFKWVATDTLQLWVNGVLAHSWTVAVVAPTTRFGSLWGLMPNLST